MKQPKKEEKIAWKTTLNKNVSLLLLLLHTKNVTAAYYDGPKKKFDVKNEKVFARLFLRLRRAVPRR